MSLRVWEMKPVICFIRNDVNVNSFSGEWLFGWLFWEGLTAI